MTGPADIPDDALADLLDDGIANRSNRPGAVGSVPTTEICTPAIADGSGKPRRHDPDAGRRNQAPRRRWVAPGGVLDAVTGGKIRTVLRAVASRSRRSSASPTSSPAASSASSSAGLTAAELGLYTLVKGTSNDRPQAQAHPARRAHPDR